jgi:hypothetical protein
MWTRLVNEARQELNWNFKYCKLNVVQSKNHELVIKNLILYPRVKPEENIKIDRPYEWCGGSYRLEGNSTMVRAKFGLDRPGHSQWRHKWDHFCWSQ